MNDAPNAATTEELTHELTRDALAAMTGYSPDDYDARAPYGNPLTDHTHGQSHNWTRHLIPDNTVDFIRQFDSIAEGIARVVEIAFDNLYDYSPETARADIPKYAVIGAVKAIAGRFGVGATGERFFANTVNTVPRQNGDEDAGIDVRTNDETFQVKTADSRRSDWNKKEADTLIWVKPTENGWEIREME